MENVPDAKWVIKEMVKDACEKFKIANDYWQMDFAQDVWMDIM